MRISPGFTTDDWLLLRPKLNDFGDTEAWDTAGEIFEDRIGSRFLEPIRCLQRSERSRELGFGFAIVTLDCLLIDTIQSFREGRTRGSERSTRQAFKQFFRASAKLRAAFTSTALIDKFYDAIRCGLMHDGETRKGWLLTAHPNEKIIEGSGHNWTLHRNDFHKAIEDEFNEYRKALCSPEAGPVRRNFLKRMDAICRLTETSEDSVLYFAYGSNMSSFVLKKREVAVKGVPVRARLDGYELLFNKKGDDGTGKANIQPAVENKSVLGCLFELAEEEFEKLSRFESGYFIVEVTAVCENDSVPVRAKTFIGKPDFLCAVPPSEEYLAKLMAGAEELGLPSDYRALVREKAK